MEDHPMEEEDPKAERARLWSYLKSYDPVRFGWRNQRQIQALFSLTHSEPLIVILDNPLNRFCVAQLIANGVAPEQKVSDRAEEQFALWRAKFDQTIYAIGNSTVMQKAGFSSALPCGEDFTSEFQHWLPTIEFTLEARHLVSVSRKPERVMLCGIWGETSSLAHRQIYGYTSEIVKPVSKGCCKILDYQDDRMSLEAKTVRCDDLDYIWKYCEMGHIVKDYFMNRYECGSPLRQMEGRNCFILLFHLKDRESFNAVVQTWARVFSSTWSRYISTRLSDPNKMLRCVYVVGNSSGVANPQDRVIRDPEIQRLTANIRSALLGLDGTVEIPLCVKYQEVDVTDKSQVDQLFCQMVRKNEEICNIHKKKYWFDWERIRLLLSLPEGLLVPEVPPTIGLLMMEMDGLIPFNGRPKK